MSFREGIYKFISWRAFGPEGNKLYIPEQNSWYSVYYECLSWVLRVYHEFLRVYHEFWGEFRAFPKWRHFPWKQTWRQLIINFLIFTGNEPTYNKLRLYGASLALRRFHVFIEQVFLHPTAFFEFFFNMHSWAAALMWHKCSVFHFSFRWTYPGNISSVMAWPLMRHFTVHVRVLRADHRLSEKGFKSVSKLW